MNIFESWVSIVNYDICDVLSTYERLFDKLDIDIYNYGEYFYEWTDAEILQDNCKKILLYKAQEEGIISDEIDIFNCFSIDNEFAISSEVDNYKQIVEDFEDWCGIKLNVF